MAWAQTNVSEAPTVAEVNGVKYTTFAEAAAAAQAGSEIKLLANIDGYITVPANVTLNGNDFAISGGIFAEGDITFAGVTTAADFDANVANTAVNIPAGASLQLTGTARLVIGHGATFNITGTIEDAKTADKATLVPSLKIAAGASITGNGVTFNVNNAYIVANANTTSKNSNANGTLDFNINNSIWEQTGVLAFYVPTSGKDPVVNFELKNSVLTTTSHLVFSVTKGEIVIDNSLVNQGASRQIENRSTMTIKNGSVVNGAVATSSNAINPGTIIVENATYAVTGEFSGAAEGTGTLVIKKGANVSVGSIKAGANVTVDAEGMAAGDEINFTANLSQFTGTLSVINNDKLEASIVDGKIVLAERPAAKIGDVEYTTLEAAFKAATSGCTIDILSDVTVDYNWDARYTGGKFTVPVTINGNDKTIKFTASVNDNNYQAPFRFEADATVKGLIIDMSEVTDNRFRAISSKGNLTVDGCKFIGKDETLNCRAVIFGEGAGANVGNLAISITNSEFINWKRGITDNENVQDVKTVTITGNTLTDAGVGVSAKETVTFTDNTVAGAYVNIQSYTAGNKLAVTATGNTLEANTDSAYNVIDAGGKVEAEGFKIIAKGNDFTGYTRGDAIWGEVWGNATESFVIKVLDANGSVMGTTSLNNIGGIIDGDVNVTWNIKLDAASNTDEYWTMAWTTAPTIDNMPAKVELWVDGVKVSGGNVVLNGPDEIAKIYAAVTDASGKILGYHTDIQEAIKAAAAVTSVARTATAGTVEVLSDVTVDKWIMFSERLSIGNGNIITTPINGVTIDGNDNTLTIKSIESAGNGNRLFYDATNLNIKDLTIEYVDAAASQGGIGLTSGTISDVTFIGGGNAILPGTGDITVKDCTFKTNGTSIYYEEGRDNLVVTGNTFENPDNVNVILLRGNTTFTDNTVISGRTVNVVSGSPVVSGNDFNDVRFKVYNEATATISDNKINNLVFNETNAPAASTFTADNTLSAEAQAAIEALPVMAGDGTEANPYTIGNLAQLKAFRDDVNAGNNYQGKFVKLTADIDLNNEEWTPIGNVTYDSKYKPTDASKVFSGVFNGNGKVISNLKVASTVGGVDTQANVGLFGITGEGAVIKDLTLTNVNIETDGRNVGALAGFAYKATLSNITVNGNIQINGGNNVAGVAGMTRYYDMSATNISVSGANGSAIVGNNIVGGIFAEIAPNGSEQTFKGLNVENVAITGVGGVGGIVGLLTTGTVENVSVKNVALTGRTDYQGNAMGRIRLGSVAGLMGSKYATIANETVENVTAKNLDGNAVELPVIGANYDAASNATEAKIGNTYYNTLQNALDAAAAGTGNVTVSILADVNLTGVDWNPVTVSAPGYPEVTVEGGNHTITGLNDMLFHSTWAGKSGLIIKDLTIANSEIVNDKDDAAGNVGVGAFIGYPQASATITLENCHLMNSSVEGGHWTGGLIGMAGGYNGNDGPVFMNLTIKGCSVTGSTITGKGSVGGVIGHGSCAAWTNVVIEETTVSGNTITSTGSSNVKAGAVMGTIGAAGQPTTANGETKTGGMSVSATVADNTVTSNSTAITTIYGRQGTETGMLYVAGGSYDNYPIEEGVAYAAPAAGYKIEQNTDGTYGVVVDPAYGMVAKVGDEYFATLQEAINAAQNDETVVLLNTITLADADMVKTEDNRNVMLNISNKSITLDLNENTINIDYNGGQYLFAAVYVADGAGLTVTGNGKIDIAENGINVAYMFWKRGTTGYLTIENGTFHMDDSGDSMVYTNGDEIVTVNGGTFTIDNIDTRPNQFPCIFNAAGQNTANIIVNGGTFNDDVAHQYYPFEVMMPREKALKKSESENLWTVVDAVAYVAEKEGQYINEVGYATLAEAIAAAEAGETVTILAGDFTQNLDVQKTITVAGETDAEGNNLVNFAGKLNITADGATVKNINVNNGGSSAGYINAKNVTVDGCQVVGGNGFRECYTEGTVTFKNSVIIGSTYGIHFDGSANGNIVIDNCTITGWTSFAATITKVTMKDTRFDNGNYNYVRFYQGAELTGCSFNEEMNVDFAVDGVEVTVADCTVDGDRTVEDLFEGKDIANSSITVDGVKLARIAKIGDEYYETITAAINAAANGATVEILAGEHSEYVAPWKTDTQHKTEKSITLVGAADFATVLTGGMYLGYDDSQCREHNIVVKGIAFQGKGLTVACQQNVTIEDNKFTNITEGRAIAVIGKDINSVVKNNVIENVASAVGIELRNTLTATVEGNTISGTGHNALQITSQVGSTASTATVLNNTMSDWGVNGEGRAMRFEGIVTATVNGNVMHHTAAPEEFVKITNTTTLDASANYWNGVSPMTSGMFTGVEGDPIAVLKNYYTDAEKTNLVEFSAAGSAARIGSAYFETLAAAITAAQANDVITFLTDINESVTVNKNVTIDGAGKQYTGTMTGNAGLTITVQNVNFVNGGFDKSTKSTTGTYTIKNCTFTDQGSYAYALRFKGASKVVVEDCTVKGYQYSFLYVTAGTNTVSVKNVTVEDCPSYAVYFASGVNNATFENLTVKNSNNGFVINNTANRAFTMKDCTMENVATAINHANGTNAITCTVLGANDFGTAAVSEYVVYKNAAMVGTTIYGDLNDAFADENAGTVTLLGNIEMNATAVVGAGKEITLDLNGKTASMADASGATACAIKNNGELTITDGSDTKDGKITFASTTPSANNGYASNAISNYATITIEAGTIENLTVGGACYALDNYAGSTSTINGGKLIAEKTTVRIFNWTDGEAAKATLNVTDGEIISKDGYGINVNSGNTPHVELNISGGVITTDDTDYNLAVYVVNKNSAENFTINVDGGTFNGNFALNGVTSTTMAEGAISVTDGTFEGVICYDEPAYGFITGGTYQTVVEESYCALGYQPVLNEEGTYTVEYTGKVSELTIVDGEFTEFVNKQEVTVETLTYKRELYNDLLWNALFVPFEVPVSMLTDLGLEVVYFNDVHSYDDDNDGTIDKMTMESIKLTSGKLRANHPYMFRRASDEAVLELDLTFTNAKLFSTNDDALMNIGCSSAYTNYTISGTYTTMTAEDLDGRLIINEYGNWSPMDSQWTLSPFRLHLAIEQKDGSPVIIEELALRAIPIRVIGEENEDGTTTIYDVEYNEQTVDYIYDLQGRRVLEPQKGGLYIVNGKKVLF